MRKRVAIGAAVTSLVAVVAVSASGSRAKDTDASHPALTSIAGATEYTGQPSRGPADASVVIVEYVDYGCDHCGTFHRETLEQLLAMHPEVRYEVRNFPAPELHPLADKAAEAAECTHAQGRFWEFQREWFRSKSTVTIPNLVVAASSAGLDRAAFEKCVVDGRMAEAVRADILTAEAEGVRGTPTFFVNGRKTEGAKPIEHFEAEIAAAAAEN